ncbi:hypothetical protein DFJ67_3526 [Asanoa ferruginea]|uniref:Uncharacterized protein n=1 Tax=Asanoa ferruginea TaxID=53367 RepID=A0A3D9ZLQ6_9ACTN|nr:hypothetical protein DFJ67_3526 [Asanoa ferruginea]
MAGEYTVLEALGGDAGKQPNPTADRTRFER